MKKYLALLVSVSLLSLCAGRGYAGTKAVMDQVCTMCHNIARPMTKKKDRAGWEATVKRMASKTNKISAEQSVQIVDFLSKIRDINASFQSAKDSAHLTDIEKLHVPNIEAPASVAPRSVAKVKVEVGQQAHPMTKEHNIFAIELYVNNRWVDLVELEPGQEPKAELSGTIFKTFPIEVVAHCNVDGSWSVKSEIKAE